MNDLQIKKDIDRWVTDMVKLLEYARVEGILDNTDPETDLADLLADLMHYCDHLDIDFSYVLAKGQGHYIEEIAEFQETQE